MWGEGRWCRKDFKQNGLLIEFIASKNPRVEVSFNVTPDRHLLLIHLRAERRVWMCSLHPSVLSAFSPPPVCFDQRLERRGAQLALIFLAAAPGCWAADHSRRCFASSISCLQMHFLADHAIKELPSITGLPVPAGPSGAEAEAAAGGRSGALRCVPAACTGEAAPGRAGAWERSRAGRGGTGERAGSAPGFPPPPGAGRGAVAALLTGGGGSGGKPGGPGRGGSFRTPARLRGGGASFCSPAAPSRRPRAPVPPGSRFLPVLVAAPDTPCAPGAKRGSPGSGGSSDCGRVVFTPRAAEPEPRAGGWVSPQPGSVSPVGVRAVGLSLGAGPGVCWWNRSWGSVQWGLQTTLMG